MVIKHSKELYLHNQLKHINISNGHDFSALFVVNTPITDNSGIAHCVEHLIFRASKAFPHAETLFQLTALTDVKINASTLADTTYFHCQSPYSETFNLALNYLFNGLFNPIFHHEDLSKEIHDGQHCGVIYRELIGLKNQDKQEDKQLIDESSTQESNVYNYSGDSQLIGQLSVNDLQKFHQQYYQASNITLVTANADIDHVSRLMSQVMNHHVSINHKYSLEAIAQEKINKQTDNKQQQKYSQEINELIEVYYHWLKNSSNQNLDKQKVFKKIIAEQTDKLKSPIENSCTDVIKSDLIQPLITLSQRLEKKYFNYQEIKYQSIKNKISTTIKKPDPKQALPALFNKLYFKAKNQLITNLERNNLAYVYDQHNTLLLIKMDKTVQKSVYIMSYIINAYPKFLTPRCQGLCYAIQALVIEPLTIEHPFYLAIYSAFDCTPSLRLKNINQSLLQLSQDISFIQESLLLAKIKYCRKYHVEIYTLNDITPVNISGSLLTLASKDYS